MISNKLKGLRILNTRPSDQAVKLSMLITQHGGYSIERPMLAIQATDNTWVKKIPTLTSIHQAIFVSPNAVQYFFKTMAPNTWPASIYTTAIGSATANALTTNHLQVHQIPKQADSEHLLKLNHFKHIAQQNILLVKGKGGLSILSDYLSAHRANLIEVNVYERTAPNIPQDELDYLWQTDAIDVIIITSQEAMQNLFTLFGKKAYAWLCQKPFFVLSDRLAHIARSYGVTTVIISHHDTLLSTIEAYVYAR